jgi:TonB-linked SusC/RagA family outer membrane protein
MNKLLVFCFILLSGLLTEAMAQSRTVTGRVTDGTNNEGLPGVTVLVKGTQIGSSTDVNGNYSINVPADGTTLVFSFVGFTTTERVIGNATAVNVTLASDAKALGEVVVMGAGGIERQVKEQGYSTTNVTSDELVQGKSPNIATGLTGKVAGLQINAVGSGVNPTVRVVLRGMRSLTGNNQALIVLDNVIVPNEVLGNLNPEDVDNVSVLNGANAAALYGSDASNGAIIITTKKGKKGINTVRVGHTTTLEQISFYPELQDKFGSGYYGGVPHYEPFENQQYGPAFDGSMVEIGRPLENGDIQTIPYSPTRDKYEFWETGVQNQTDFSLSSGTERSTFYVSGQRFASTGTTPNDEYRRIALRINGTHDLGNKLRLNFNSSYTTNTYDITPATADIYDQLLNTPAHIPLTKLRDWQNDPFANPNGYYNEYYRNPYFTIDNQRSKTKNNYLIGNVELKYNPLDWLEFTYRAGITNRNVMSKSTMGVFQFSNYTKSVTNTTAKSDIAGAVGDESTTTNQINSEFQTKFEKAVNDFDFKLIVGNQIRDNSSKTIGVGANGLVNPGLYNVNNRIGEPNAFEANYQARQVGVYGDLTIGYKDYLYLHLTGRNDWNSTLAKENRSFFYPAADIAFTISEAIPALQNNSIINHLKLRGGVSQVGQVNFGTSGITYGAYRLRPTFSPTAGFPFGTLTGYSVGNQIVAPNLNPEMTKGFEFGFDGTFYKDMFETKFTYYATRTIDQTVGTGVSNTTGYSSFLTNTGEVVNRGIESVLFFTPVRNNTWTVTAGGNYTYNRGEVISISSDLPQLALSTGSQAQVYAVANNYFPVLMGSDYNRDDQGRIIVDRFSGLPSIAADQVMLGNTEPIHRLGLEGQVKFKSFRLTTLFEYRGDFYRFHSGASTLDFSGSSARSASFNRDRFVIPNSSFEDPENPGEYIANNNITVNNGSADFWAAGINRDVASNYVTRADYITVGNTSPVSKLQPI